MSIFLAAFICCAVFCFLRLRAGPIERTISSALSGSVATALIALVILASVFAVLKEQGESVLAWTGVETAGTELTIGDAGSGSSTGWPNGAFGPTLTVNCPEAQSCNLQPGGGDGFIRYGDQILNGEHLNRETPVKVGGYQVNLVSGVFELPFIGQVESRLARPRFRIDGPSGPIAYSSNLDREFKAETMDRLLAEPIAELRRDSWVPGKDTWARVAMDLERWSSGLRVLPGGRNEAWVLSPEPDQPAANARVSLPANLDVLWPSRTLRTELTRTSKSGVRLHFIGPWQSSSPVPGASPGANGEVELTVTSKPQPHDVAFLIPSITDQSFRHVLKMRDGLFEGSTAQARLTDTATGIPGYLINQRNRYDVESSNASPGSTSLAVVPVGDQSAVVETIRVQPKFWLIALGVFVAWLVTTFALDVTLVKPRKAPYQQIQGIRADDQQTLSALTVVLWTFLLLRLALSLRYAKDAAHVDRVVVEGVMWALFGIATVPALVLRAAMMWLPRAQDPNPTDGKRLRLLTGLVMLAGAIEVALVEYGVWPDLRPEFRRIDGFRGWALFLFLLLIVFLWNWIRVNHEYFWGQRAGVDTESDRKLQEILHNLVTEVSTRYASFARNPDAPLWRHLNRTELDNRSFWRWYVIVAFFVALFVFLYARLYWVLQVFFPGAEPLKEVLAPLVICLPPICYLLNSRVAFPAGFRATPGEPALDWLRSICVTGALIVLLAVVYPIALHDAGAFVVTLALFTPTVAVLLLGGRPWRIPLLVGGFLAVGFICAALVTLEFGPASALNFGEAKGRILEFKHPHEVEGLLLVAGVSAPDARAGDPPLSASRMRQTHQHLWEMQAISHLGGVGGLGFAQAPVRNSQVRQDTIQYDSTFSFFVLSEHGLVGGCSLLALYSLPLMLVLCSSRRKLDVGHGLALVLACSFFLEGLSHALMNIGSLPETGRSMPLLAVKSISDLLRWMIFFRVMAQALLWRVNSAESGYMNDPSLLAESGSDASGVGSVRPWAPLILGGGAVILIALLAFENVRVIRDKGLEVLTWQGLLDATNQAIDGKAFKLSAGRIQPGDKIKRAGELLFLQEIARFNEMTPEEKLTGLSREAAMRFCTDAQTVHDIAGFDQLMMKLRRTDRGRTGTLRPSLFILRRVSAPGSGDSPEEDEDLTSGPCAIPPDGRLRLMANPAFVSRTRFDRHVDLIKPVYLGSGREEIMGPAWVDGRQVNAVNQDSLVPWIGYLQTAMANADFEPEADKEGKVVLTLDARLQASAQEFVADRGRKWHEVLLEKNSADAPGQIEPPRAALAIVNLVNGEVLGLGGYPRMTSAPAWGRDRVTGELIPPSRWIERDAPTSIRVRYGSDRNFDRLLMGSSTKPIWAAAALSVNSNVASVLGVKGPKGTEAEVFGIPVGNGWEIDGPSSGLAGGWCDFKSYLARSDNRYHIRLGFLSLSQWADTQPESGKSRPYTSAATETIDLVHVWQQYPVFPADLGFSDVKPKAMGNLAEQGLSKRLASMFGVHLTSDEPESVRSSFWTGDEQDDTRLPKASLASISPETVNMELDKVTSPRDFITLLLGGNTNRWANVDFAGAFGSAVLGRPVVPHVVRLSRPAVSSRVLNPKLAAILRPGLEAAFSDHTGTVWKQFGNNAPLMTELLRRHPGFHIYAKTGTLPEAKGKPNTSRLVLALVSWDNAGTNIQTGLVFSMVIDRGRTGLAADWLGQYILANESELSRVLAQQ